MVNDCVLFIAFHNNHIQVTLLSITLKRNIEVKSNKQLHINIM